MATRGVSVTNKLRDALLSGEYIGGARLNEVDLATALNVSRTPIRVALSTLAAEGLLDYRPNSGYAVKAFAGKDIEGIYLVRSTLEGLVARMVAEKGISDQHRGRLHKVLSDSDTLLSSISEFDKNASDAWRDLNDEFHNTLIEAADNNHLGEMLRKSRAIPLLKELKFRWYDMSKVARAHEDHADVFSAIVNRQVARAESISSEHIYRAGQTIIEHWRKIEVQKSAPPRRGRAA